MRWLLPFLLVTTVGCGPKHTSPWPEPWEWDDARKVAEKWATDVRGVDASEIGDPIKRLPFTFQTTASQTGLVVVYNSMVWTDTGVNELARYLHDADIYKTEALTQSEALLIVTHFQALPPISDRDGKPTEYDKSESPLGPDFRWTDHKMELTVRYQLPHAAGASRIWVAEWSIVLGKGLQPKWHEERKEYDLDNQRFIRDE
jgi:hypothetical protein